MMKSWIPKALLAVAVVLAASACTPTELKQWYTDNGIDYSHMSEAEINQTAANVTEFFNHLDIYDTYAGYLSDGQLEALRSCEASGNYGAVSGGGTYRGAYQFSVSTWNSTAARHFPWLVGIDPAAAGPWDQDAMARALYSTNGRSPWPVCGRRV